LYKNFRLRTLEHSSTIGPCPNFRG
jgi:hypothetical protein